MKIVFAGSPEFSVPALEKLIACGKVVGVITQPDKPVGRKQILTPTPVKACALKCGLPVLDFKKIGEHMGEVRALGGDIMITCAYGQILPRAILDMFAGGVWNLHASLLPKFRGASPVQAAILAGESHTGITVMKTEEGLDCGDMLLVKRCAVGDKTCGELSAELSYLAAEAAVEAVKFLEKGNVQLLMQDEGGVSYCRKIEKSDAKLNFAEPASTVIKKIKAFSPSPAAFCNFNGGILNIYNAQLAQDGQALPGVVTAADKRGVTVKCGEGAILITELQPAGGKRMPAADFVNGRKIKAGDKLD